MTSTIRCCGGTGTVPSAQWRNSSKRTCKFDDKQVPRGQTPRPRNPGTRGLTPWYLSHSKDIHRRGCQSFACPFGKDVSVLHTDAAQARIKHLGLHGENDTGFQRHIEL